MSRPYSPGDPVIYHKAKYSPTPGPRARGVNPTPHGEDYAYVVDKYWLVKECQADGMLLLVTRRGKQHVVREDSPNLRHANWWEKFIHRGRFPELDPATGKVQEELPAQSTI
jgi:hypothetical protein